MQADGMHLQGLDRSCMRTFHAYEEVPQHEVPKLVEAARKEREELAAAR
jgi:hypothetical protein